ncbi:MAG: hypothetical protein ACLPU9_04825 [Thermoplasmata archaeon]
MSGTNPPFPRATDPPPDPTAAPVVFVGSNGAADDGSGLLTALKKARILRSRLVVQGALTIRSPTNLLSGDVIEFDNATLTIGFNGNVFNEAGQSNLTMLGTVTVKGGRTQGFSGNGWLILGGSNIRFDWHCLCSDFSTSPSKYLILGKPNETTGGNGFVLRGQTVTADSTVVNLTDWSNVDISGVHSPPGGMTGMAPVAVVNIKCDATAGPVRGINVHDCQIDGGGVQKASGLITVKGTVGPGNIREVVLKNLELRNTCPVPGPGLLDACDVIGATDVTIDNVRGDTAFHGVGCIASHAAIANVVFEHLNGRAVAVGDASVQGENISDDTVTNCVGTDCGQTTLGPGSGFIVASSAGFSVERVTFTGCRTRDTTGHSQRYGFQITAHGIVKDVVLDGGEYSGFGESIHNPSGSNLIIRGAKV